MTALIYDAKEDADLRGKNQPRRPPLTFSRFLGLSEEESDRLQKETLTAQTAGLTSSLALALAHELGHCVLGHAIPEKQSSSDAEREKWESDADAYAFNAVARLTSRKPEYRVVMGLPAFAFLSYVDALRSQKRREVPILAPRMLQAAQEVLEQCNKDHVFQDELSKAGLVAEWTAMAKSLQELAEAATKQPDADAVSDRGPGAQVECLVKRLGTSSTQGAFVEFFAGSLAAQSKQTEFRYLETQAKSAFDMIGRPVSYEIVESNRLGTALIRLKWITKHDDELPLFWNGLFYRRHNNWEPLNVFFVDDPNKVGF